MGLLDLPAPLFDAIEELLAFLPVLLRLLLWGTVAGIASMLLYGALSPQQRIATVKGELKTAQAEMQAADESFAELMALTRRSLGLSFKHLGLVLGPALISAIPMICVMAWASNQYGYSMPQAGDRVAVGAIPAKATGQLAWQSLPANAAEEGRWTINWPAKGDTLVLAGTGDAAVLALPLQAPIPQVHKKLWWNSLLGNPAGYLPDDSPAEVLFLELPDQSHLPFGPGWLGHWLTVFLVASVTGALLTKRLFRIH